MSDTTGFLAGCATTGVVVLLLLVARVGLDESPPVVQSRSNSVEATPPIPVPSPPTPVREQAVMDQPFRRDFERQQDLVARLESQLDDHKVLIRDLEDQLDQQQIETAAIVAQLKEYKYSMDTLAAQQVKAVESSRLAAAGEGQTALLWVGASLVLILIFGGGVVLVVLIIMTAQNRRRTSRTSEIAHPINVTPSYQYYQHEFLPPQINPRHAEQYEPYDYGG